MEGETIVSAIYGFVMGLWAIWHGGSLERAQKARLRKMLSHERWEWRSIAWLSAAISADRKMTAALLVQIDARPRTVGSKWWGLISRVGPA
jgi:hypothetical protein